MTVGVSDPADAGPRRGRRASPPPRRRVSVIGIFGELLITAGALVLAFLGWQIWLGDLIMGAQLNGEASEQSQEWGSGYSDIPAAEAGDPVLSAEPPVLAAPGNAERFANLIIPRFGPDYIRPIAQGVGNRDVLDRGNVGHYPTTQMPGEYGNFAVAAHRTSWGGNFHDLHQLVVGDRIYVETADGWYVYVFRNLEYVRPTGVDVLNPVPQAPEVEADERYLTMTTCNPLFSAAERLIAYSVFDTFYPRDGGAPAELVGTIGAG